MEQHGRHAWTLEDLQAGLAEAAATADFSSVYRAAEKLVAEGVLVKLLLDDGRARFELAAPHHDHLHCTRCGVLVPVPCPLGDVAEIERRTGAVVRDHSLVLSGLCRDCRDPGRIGER
jgi:Fe2+ or Zn2+ uptake regulation protein